MNTEEIDVIDEWLFPAFYTREEELVLTQALVLLIKSMEKERTMTQDERGIIEIISKKIGYPFMTWNRYPA